MARERIVFTTETMTPLFQSLRFEMTPRLLEVRRDVEDWDHHEAIEF